MRVKRTFKNDARIALIVMMICGIMISIAVFPLYAGVPEQPHNADSMWVEPSTVELSTDTHSVGYKFNVTVWINLTLLCGGWQFNMIYNKAHLKCTGCAYTAGDHSQFFENITTLSLDPDFGSHNATHDFVMHGEVWFMGDMRTAGYGSLSWVEFEVMAEPSEGETLTSLLDISTSHQPPASDTFALDENGDEIPLNVFNGVYRFTSPGGPPPPTYILTIETTVGGSTDPTPGSYTYTEGSPATVTALPSSGYEFDHWVLDGATRTENPIIITMDRNYSLTAHFTVSPPTGARLYVDPANITDPTITPSSLFSVNVTVDDVVNLTVCEFNLSYDPDVLGWISIEFLKVQDQIPTPKMTLDDEAGFAWIKLTYSTPITTEDPLPLVRITFHVEAFGISILDLHDTQLTNSDGKPIDHEAEDGFFCTLIRDVAITSVVPYCSWAYEGWEVKINVTAKNKGDIKETFTVIAYYNENQVGNFTIKDLLPSNETTIVFIWDTKNVTSCVNYTISAYASPVPYEFRITDNEYIDGEIKVRIMGDVTGDGKVNVQDIFRASKAFGSYPGIPNWDPDVDLNRDLKINVRDFYRVAKNFGKECPS